MSSNDDTRPGEMADAELDQLLAAANSELLGRIEATADPQRALIEIMAKPVVAAGSEVNVASRPDLPPAGQTATIVVRNGTLTSALVLARDRDRVLGRSRIIDPNPASGLAEHLEKRDGRTHGEIQARSMAVRVAPAAGWLMDAASRLIPAGERARYAEEFRSELWEIARAGGGWRMQLAYAAGLMLAARRLRSNLRAPRRRSVKL